MKLSFSIMNSVRPYLDPGSGSMIIQMVIAAVLGLGVVLRVFWKNIMAFFTGKKANDDALEDPTTILDDYKTEVSDECINDSIADGRAPSTQQNE